METIYDRAHSALVRRLSAGALAHSERVAETAARIAGVYGLDPDAARLAGLLHDWSREMTAPALIERARELGMDITDVDEAVPYLLHGPVGQADIAEAVPELSSEVLGAIGAHTFGAPGMTPLAMVVYIADTIEPSRKHEGVEGLRASVGAHSLADLFTDAYAMSLHHLLDARRRIHPRTVETWNELVSGSDA